MNNKKLDFISPKFREKIKLAIQHLDTSIDSLYELAVRDEKTGLYNHRFFKNIFSIELEKAKRGKKLSLIIIDIDFFKKINDTYGHLVGDKMIKALADLLKESFRKSDVIARFGGEEFFIMLPNTSINKAKIVAERIRKKVLKSKLKKYKITISLGVAEYKKADNFQRIEERADKALYKAKKEGRNRVCC